MNTKYDLDLVKSRLTENKHLSEICKELGYPYRYISRLLVSQGISCKDRKVHKLSKEMILYAYELYKQGYSIKKIANILSVHWDTVRRGFKDLGFEVENRKININTNNFFFQNIDTEEKAYLLGFFAADGTINKTWNGMAILIQSDDVEILEYYKKAFNDTKPFYKYPKKSPNHKDKLKFVFNSKINKEILLKKGFPCNKTYEMFALPNTFTTPDLYRHFIRGYFDGDGSIIFPTKRSRVTKFKITSSNLDFLKFCMKEFGKQGCYNMYIEEPINNFAKNLCLQNKPSITKLYHYLYDDATFYLKRKYEKMKFVALSIGDNGVIKP